MPNARLSDGNIYIRSNNIQYNNYEKYKGKAEEYAKTKHTNQNLIEIVSWDFEAGANYVLDLLIAEDDKYDTVMECYYALASLIRELKSNQK